MTEGEASPVPQPPVSGTGDTHGDYDKMIHRDWCDDGTCWCRRQIKQ